MDAVVRYTIGQPGNEQVRSVNALVGETNDGGLNDIRGLHVRGDHVLDAIRGATGGAVAEGSVGAGTGTICYGWKGGIGTSSRKIASRTAPDRREYTVGVLAQTNFGGNLTISGVPVFKSLQPPSRRAGGNERMFGATADGRGSADGSCMLVVATDAPLDARDLGRLAARAVFGLARTGSSYSNGSGDFAIAFSTSP
jgi:D-aminopeptidase